MGNIRRSIDGTRLLQEAHDLTFGTIDANRFNLSELVHPCEVDLRHGFVGAREYGIDKCFQGILSNNDLVNYQLRGELGAVVHLMLFGLTNVAGPGFAA